MKLFNLGIIGLANALTHNGDGTGGPAPGINSYVAVVVRLEIS